MQRRPPWTPFWNNTFPKVRFSKIFSMLFRHQILPKTVEKPFVAICLGWGTFCRKLTRLICVCVYKAFLYECTVCLCMYCMCMYLCMHVYVCMYVFIFMYACMYVCTYVCTVCMHVYVCMNDVRRSTIIRATVCIFPVWAKDRNNTYTLFSSFYNLTLKNLVWWIALIYDCSQSEKTKFTLVKCFDHLSWTWSIVYGLTRHPPRTV